jgi:hypothetical protein
VLPFIGHDVVEDDAVGRHEKAEDDEESDEED